jgi:hypothetical protein
MHETGGRNTPALLLADEDFKTGLRNWWHSQVNNDYRRVQQPVFLTAAPDAGARAVSGLR